MSSTPEERKDHCIKLHKFPHDFRFDRTKKQSTSEDRMDTTETDAKSSAKPKKTMFHFGNKSQKAFSSKKVNPLETITDLKKSLPDN